MMNVSGFACRLVSTILLSLLLCILPSVTFAATEKRCETYVQNSLLQYQENLENFCEYHEYESSRWNDDAEGQQKWCLGVSEEALSWETSARHDSLDSCKSFNQGENKTYNEVFAQFKLDHPEYSGFALSKKHNSGLVNADRGDVNKDGYDEIIFLMQGRPDSGQSISRYHHKYLPKRIVVLKGLSNGKYKTLLINQGSAESFGWGDKLSVEIDSTPVDGLPFFQVGVYLGSLSKYDHPGTSKRLKFGMKSDKLPLYYISSVESWRYESGLPPREFDYDFMVKRYEEKWTVIVDDYKRGDWEGGSLKLKDNMKYIYMENDTDVFSEREYSKVAPAFIVDNVIRMSKDKAKNN